MRKLATILTMVTAAAALVAAVIALPAASAYAKGKKTAEVVILKCLQFDDPSLDVEGGAVTGPFVLRFSSSPGLPQPLPECKVCSPGAGCAVEGQSCATCLSVLLNSNDCKAKDQFFTSPITVAEGDEGALGSAAFQGASIELYVLTCFVK